MKKMRMLFTIAMLFCSVADTGWTATSDQFSTWKHIDTHDGAARRVCSLISATSGVSSKNIAIKAVSEEKTIRVTLYKPSWNVEAGSKVPLRLVFGTGEWLEVMTYGRGRAIDGVVPLEHFGPLMSAMAEQPTIVVQFPKGKEVGWEIPLTGARQAIKDFLPCVQSLEATQPN